MDWNTILSSVLQAVLIVLLPPVIAAFVRWIWAQGSALWESIQSTRPGLAEILEQVSIFAVKAAEQAGLAGLIEDKKEYALSIAEIWLADQGITIDLVLVDAAIEKAVADLNLSKTKY